MFRTATTQDINKRFVNARSGEHVEEQKPPKKVLGTSGTTLWETPADIANLLASWAWLPDQSVVNVSNRAKMLLDYNLTAGANEDAVWGSGVFVERKYLR